MSLFKLFQSLFRRFRKSAPQSDRLPLYRDGCFHPARINPNHIPGPAETALRELSKTWATRENELTRNFEALLGIIDHARGEAFFELVSDMGRNADTAFNHEPLLQGLYNAEKTARKNFDLAMSNAYQHMRFVLSLVTIQGK